jgi:predicted TIM-barrel fold metal-dependent hydrolase
LTELNRIPKVDAHHHLWDADRHRYPGRSSTAASFFRQYLVHDFLADAANQSLLKSVHLQGEIARDQSLTETQWLQQIADANGFPHAIVAFVPLQDPTVDALLDTHARSTNLRGIRQILNPDQCERDDLLTNSAWRAGYGRLARHGLSFDLQALPHQMADAAAVARLQPDVPMIVNHTGMPRDRSPVGMDAWRRGLAGLAQIPHVSIKISGFAMWDPQWSPDNIRPLVLETIEIFGTERCMFASNFPVDKRHATYDGLFDAFEAITSDFSAAERQLLFRTNAERIYRI